MKLYRIEHKLDGLGPYQSGRVPGMGKAHFNMDHPSPQIDPAPIDGIQRQTMTYAEGGSTHPKYVDEYMALGIDYTEVCGLRTADDVKEWFAGYGQTLEDKGFVVAEYKAPKDAVRVGTKQLVFKKGRAKLIATHSPKELTGA